MEANGNVVLSARGLALGYFEKRRKVAKRKVASGLEVQLRAGEFVCLLGPNGVGKSTLIRTLTGMQKPLEGSIKLGDTLISEMSPKERARGISVVLTDSLPSGMFDGYSVAALGRHPHTSWSGSLTEHDRQRIEWALGAVGAEDLARRQISELSDGERQKIMIARALAQEAEVMLLDEPTAFLDLPRRVELMRTLRDLARNEGLAILLSTHDLDLALRSADKLWLLGPGGNLKSGMPEELAIEGEIANAFQSSEVDWDSQQGSFRMHRDACATVTVEGDGEIATWTKRALARIGYEILDTDKLGDIRVEVSIDEGEQVWVLSTPSIKKQFDGLSELIEFLKTG